MMVPHNRPWITREDRAAVDEVLESRHIAPGVQVAGLETDLDRAMCLPDGWAAVCTSSGSTALLLALLANYDDGPPLQINVPTYSCVAVLHAVREAQSITVLHAVRQAQSISGTIWTRLIDSADYGVPDWGGVASEKDARTLRVHVQAHGFPGSPMKPSGGVLINDMAQALGTPTVWPYSGDVGILSFGPTKMVTGSGGGAVIAPLGIAYRVQEMLDYDNPEWKNIGPFAMNYTMSDVQAALARSQLARLSNAIGRRLHIAERYRLAAEDPDFGAVPPNAYRFLIRTRSADVWKRYLLDRGVVAITPIEHRELLHVRAGLPDDQFPVASALSRELVSLPCFPDMTELEIDTVCRAISERPDELRPV